MPSEILAPVNFGLLIPRIADVVKAVRPRRPREGLEKYFEEALYPALLELLRGQGSDDGGNDGVVIGMIVLMVYLGPDDAGFPPSVLCAELIGHALDLVELEPGHHPPGERFKWLVQLALAYGCLWGRQAKSGKPRWDEVWPQALQIMVEIVFNYLIKVMKILRESVRGFKGPDQDELRGYAALIAMEFVRKEPAPDGPKFEKYQALREWRPEIGNLYAWIQRAIQGESGQKERFRAHWFHNGLLFPLLNREGLLKVGSDVAFKKCLHRLADTDAPCAEVSEYSHEPCSRGHYYIPESIEISPKALLVVPRVYKGRKFWRCAKDGSYYDYHLPACPRCGHPRKKNQRPATLWVRSEWVLEDDESEE